jgi:hypothetical protein
MNQIDMENLLRAENSSNYYTYIRGILSLYLVEMRLRGKTE